jgi:hypothetical protein
VTTTPGFAATVYGARRATAPAALAGWTELGRKSSIKRTQRVALDAVGRRYRHVLLWITVLPAGGAAVKLGELSLCT